MDQFFEDAAAMLVVLKLVEASAGRRKQNDITWASSVGRRLNGVLEGFGALNCDASRNLLFDLVSGCADQEGEDSLLTQRLPQQRVIAAFVLTSEDNQDATRKSIERF